MIKLKSHYLSPNSKKAKLIYRFSIFCLVLILTRFIYTREDNYFKIEPPKPPSSWSYEHTDKKCNKEIAFARQFTGFARKRVTIWEMFLEDDVIKTRHEIEDFMTSLSPVKPIVQGRGIVFSAFPGSLRMVSISIRFMRSYGCNLPIEIWHYNELSYEHVIKVEALGGVVVKNASDYNVDNINYPKKSRLYAMKGAALLHTSFDEILFLDSDNIPARDPTFLFETDAFKETGALFWKDYWMTKPNNPIYKILDLPCVEENEFESGQMVIKKSNKNVQNALELAFYMQRNADLYYDLFHGDKDSFRFAWRYLRVPYHQVRPFPAIAGPSVSATNICGIAMVQFSPNWVSTLYGEPPIGHIEGPLEIMFYHINSVKDRYDPGLDIVTYYKDDIAVDGIAGFYHPNKRSCLELKQEGLGFKHETGRMEVGKEFKDKYSMFYKMWVV